MNNVLSYALRILRTGVLSKMYLCIGEYYSINDDTDSDHSIDITRSLFASDSESSLDVNVINSDNKTVRYVDLPDDIKKFLKEEGRYYREFVLPKQWADEVGVENLKRINVFDIDERCLQISLDF